MRWERGGKIIFDRVTSPACIAIPQNIYFYRGDCLLHLSDEEEPDDGDDSIMDEIEQQEGKIGAKKLRKLQDKAEKKRQREVSKNASTANYLREVLCVYPFTRKL